MDLIWKFVIRIIEFYGFESQDPRFHINSSHDENIDFIFSDFNDNDIILEFQHSQTDWLQVEVFDADRAVGTFNILFEDFFRDYKRKECEVDFTPGGSPLGSRVGIVSVGDTLYNVCLLVF